MTLWRELGDRYAESDGLARLGDAHHRAGDVESARTAWQEAIAGLDEVGHPEAERLRARLAANP